MKKKYLPLIIGAAAAVGILVGGKLNFTDSPEPIFSSNSKKDKLNRLIDYIEYEYVDEVDTDSIVDVTVNDILDKLDPHSVYIPPEDAQRVAENMQGDFVGVGISFYMRNDSIAVISALEGGPSLKAGIKPGDRVLIADNDTLYGKGLSNERIIKRLKGAANTPVSLKVYRKGEASLLNFNINRASVPIKSVDAAYMLTDNLGYIKIDRFAETTFKEFKKALDNLIAQGADQLALDLRDNPGGYLGIAEEIADEFLEDEKLILFTKNKKGKIDKTYATERGDFEDGHVYVIINERSASASEIIAGALQDNDKGTIVGRRSFGKGLVQREMALGDGSSVRLTISRYYTPTGRSIQRPYENGNKDYYKEIYSRYHNGEMKSADSIKVADSLKFTTPKGKIVYGGGGIIPDVFVPARNTLEEEGLEFLLRSAFLNNFVFDYLDRDRKRYDGLTEDEFVNMVDIEESNFEEFKLLAQRQNINIAFGAYRIKIKQFIKAIIAQQLYGTNAYERILNKGDRMVEKVIELSKEKALLEQEMVD
ncbi:S41 family peptidase [Sungkyunkwania multivorans]|uniref:S41 family peptidase n=1 Tax=Sungkyunkwania multivorans TaxID=1173618 RepID=A0ABW3CYW2_9FLAO